MNCSVPATSNKSQQHEIAPWRPALSRALHRNRSQPFCRFLQLATVREDGSPANRTIVFRGFLDTLSARGNQLTFISDRRSEKIQQIQRNETVEACWYFTKTREQFRISGQMIVVSADESVPELASARVQTWQKISANARQQFTWPQPKAPRSEAAVFDTTQPDDQTPLAAFCLLLLNPQRVDYLNLRGEPQDRVIYLKGTSVESDWSNSQVNP